MVEFILESLANLYLSILDAFCDDHPTNKEIAKDNLRDNSARNHLIKKRTAVSSDKFLAEKRNNKI